jgi:UDP-N-acetylmuramoyl-tripeptide--D-alanyl-D-alanine ligase
MKKFLVDILKRLIQIPASYILRKFKPEIIAITGSAGKTSTKEAIFFVLRKKFGQEVDKSEGNLNTRLGLPLAILGFKKNPSFLTWPIVLFYSFFKALLIKKYPKILVLEYAIDYPGEFKILSSFTHPKITVVTSIGPAHLQFFKNINGVFKEKSELVKVLNKDGWAILNETDQRVKKMAGLTRAKIVYFKAENPIDLAKEAAKKVAKIYGIKEEESEEILQDFKLPQGRLEIKKGIKESFIIDDCYNANPLSVSLALDFLKNFKGERKIAVLGDMLELGDYTEKGHKEVGQKAKKISDLILTTGEKAKIIAEESNGLYFKTKKELIDFLRKEIKKGDIILIKASRAMKFEEIVDEIRSTKSTLLSC